MASSKPRSGEFPRQIPRRRGAVRRWNCASSGLRRRQMCSCWPSRRRVAVPVTCPRAVALNGAALSRTARVASRASKSSV